MSGRIARIHDFNGKVAIRLLDGETQYLTPQEAELVAVALSLASKQVRNGHHLGTLEVTDLSKEKVH